MPAQPLTPEQKADAERLTFLFKRWQARQREQGLPYSQAEAAEQLELGGGQSTISQYLRGVIPLNVRMVAKCAVLLGCLPDEISPSLAAEIHALSEAAEAHLFGKSDKPISDPNSGLIKETPTRPRDNLSEQDLPQPTEEEFAFVPQLDIAAACGNGRFEDHVVVKGGLAFKKSFLRDKGVPEHAARIIYAAGGSMSPTLQDGCVVLLNLADTEPRDGKVYAICKPDDGLVLKRMIWDFHPSMGRQTWILRSDNPDKIAHPDKVLPPDDRTMIAGRAVWNDNQL